MVQIEVSLASAQDRMLDELPVVFAEHEQVPIKLMRDYQAGSTLMVAHRPLLGTQEALGDAVYGRHWVSVDHHASNFVNMVENNRKMDARVVMPMSKEAQCELALVDNDYAKAYRKMPLKQRYGSLDSIIERIEGMKLKEVRELIAKARV